MSRKGELTMNLQGLLKTITDSAKGAAKSGILIVRAHAPEAMIGGGIVGFGITVYEACKATAKAHDILEEKETIIQSMNETRATHEDYTLDKYDRDLRAITRKTRGRLIKAYAPMATTGVASIVLILGGYKILNGRYVGAVAAYKASEALFERYRGNVVDAFGEETDWRMLNGVQESEMSEALKERETNDEIEADNKGKRIGRKKTTNRYQEIHSRIFDPHSERWKRYWNGIMLLDYLKGKESELTDKLRINGHLFVNEVNDALGFKRTKEGQVVGWIFRKDKDNKVSLGISEMPEEEVRRILSTTRNDDLYVWINMNPDGVIYDLIEE